MLVPDAFFLCCPCSDFFSDLQTSIWFFTLFLILKIYLSCVPHFYGAKCSCVGVEIIFSIILALPFLVTFSKSLTSVEWTHILLDTICMTFILVWAPLSVQI